MIFHTYKPRKYPFEKRLIIEHCLRIINKYVEAGYDMTLRQLYYQLVSENIIPNNQQEYDKLQVLVGQARLSGHLPWDAIVDRTRNLVDYNSYDSPDQIVRAASYWYRRNLWEGQGMTLEVWIEKDALAGVFTGICNELRIPLFSCRGYTSLSEMWGAGVRIKERADKTGRGTFILHFGDHDPSGVDMSRDIEERIAMFTDNQRVFHFQRVALNLDLVRKYDLPPNFAKISDARLPRYEAEFGTTQCWELDALDMDVLPALVRSRWEALVDHDAWNEQQAIEDKESEELRQLAVRFKKEREAK